MRIVQCREHSFSRTCAPTQSVAEFFIIGERFVVITRQLQAAEVLSKLSSMNDKSSFIEVPLVITKQLKLHSELARTPPPHHTHLQYNLRAWFVLNP
jgi:hypothetical protein